MIFGDDDDAEEEEEEDDDDDDDEEEDTEVSFSSAFGVTVPLFLIRL